MKRYTHLYAMTTGHRFDGTIQAETYEGETRLSERVVIWQCGHGHLDYDDALRCAEKYLKKLVMSKQSK